MPQRILQRTADVDYAADMALVVLSPPDSYDHELVGLAQWISGSFDPIPEIAFQVRDDWQGEGLGTFLFLRLLEVATSLGLKKLKADVLADNKSMNAIFEKSPAVFTVHADFGVKTYIFDLTTQTKQSSG